MGLDDISAVALAWHDAGRSVAIATVVQTWGSAPRGVGSQMVIDASGAMEGSVSGGCVEGAVVSEAQEAIREGRSRLLDYGVSDGDAFAVGLACGGNIRVLVEPVGPVIPKGRLMPVPMLREIVAAKAERRTIGYAVALDGSAHRLVDDPQAGMFTVMHMPKLRLVIVGAVHIAQCLVPMARACGYLPIVVDPRSAFATAVRFPETELSVEWPDVALAQIGLDGRTGVVTLSHDPKLDDPAIMAALRSDVFYLGCLGSTRTHAARLARLAVSPAQAARIHGPVGLDLGGRAPAEIAVSIMAQVTQVLRRT